MSDPFLSASTPPSSSSQRWHIGKEIPIAIIVALIFQTGGGLWWLSQLSFKIDAAIQQLQEFRLDRYTKDDARRDRELILQIIEAQKARDFEHERRIGALEESAGRKRP